MPRDSPIFNMLRQQFKLTLCCLLLLVATACQQDNRIQTRHLSGSTMGTTWSLVMHSMPSNIEPAALQQQLQSELDRINRLMSTYDPTSEISRFNAHTHSDWFSISPDTAQVIELSQQISRLTDGAFDISVGPLVELWGFGAAKRSEQIPTEQQLSHILKQIGYQKLHLRLDPPAIKKQHPQLRIDLSAVAKGYAVDLLAGILEQQGIGNYLMEIGGELRIAGQRSAGGPWQIAIEKPLEGVREVETILPLTDTGLATSGNYRNFYVEDGQRYAHTIDPLAGKPIRHKLASVTILDPSSARADALATAIMVMGEEKGRELCENNQIAALFLIHEKQTTLVRISSTFRKLVPEEKQ